MINWMEEIIEIKKEAFSEVVKELSKKNPNIDFEKLIAEGKIKI